MKWVFALVLAAWCAAAASAQAVLDFPAENFGQPNKTYREASTRRANDEVIVGVNNFEEVWELNDANRYRRIGRSVGLLDLLVEYPDGRRANTTCTATRIDRDKILTNYHCTPGRDFRVVDARVRFGFLHRLQAVGDLYRVATAPLESDSGLDYAILQLLDSVPEDRYPIAEISPRDPADLESLFLIHHPAGRPQRLTRFECQASAPSISADRRLVHVCDTLGGSSGTAIFADNDRALAGIHHSGLSDPNEPLNFGTPASALFARSALLQRLSTRPGAPTPRETSTSFQAYCDRQKASCRETVAADYAECRDDADLAGAACRSSCRSARNSAYEACDASFSACLTSGDFASAFFETPACVASPAVRPTPQPVQPTNPAGPAAEIAGFSVMQDVSVPTPFGTVLPGVQLNIAGGSLTGALGRNAVLGARFFNYDGSPLYAAPADLVYRDTAGQVATYVNFAPTTRVHSFSGAFLVIPYAAFNFEPTNYSVRNTVFVQVEVYVDGQLITQTDRQSFSFLW